MAKEILDIVIDSAKEFNELENLKIDFSKGREARLFGGHGPLNSLGLVNFIVLVEEKIEDELDLELVIASEKAMSRRVSPFASIGTLADYIQESINE